MAAVVVADCFDRSLRCSTRYTPLPLVAAAATAASVKCQVACRRKVYGSFEYHISTQTVIIFMFRLVCFVHVHFPILAQSTTLRSCRPAAVQPPSSSMQLSARVAAVVVADCFGRSLDALSASTPPLAAAAATDAPVKCQVTCRRKV